MLFLGSLIIFFSCGQDAQLRQPMFVGTAAGNRGDYRARFRVKRRRYHARKAQTF